MIILANNLNNAKYKIGEMKKQHTELFQTKTLNLNEIIVFVCITSPSDTFSH